MYATYTNPTYDNPVVTSISPQLVSLPQEHHVHTIPAVVQVPSVQKGNKYMGIPSKYFCWVVLGVVVVIACIGVAMYYGLKEDNPPPPPPSHHDRDPPPHERDHCAENNGMCEGRCTNTRDGYECSCPSGHKLAPNHHACIAHSACKDNPCVHGSCKDTSHGYVCDCNPGYGGQHCEFELCDTDVGYVYYKGNGHCYKYYPVYVNWFQAEDHCQQTGGHLLSVNTDDERLFIDAYMNSMPHEVYDADEDTDMEFWMGLYMPSVSNPLTWYWTDESQGRAVKWQEDEPDGGNREMCGRFERGNDFDHSTYTRDFADAYPCDPHTYVDKSEPDDTFSNNPFLCELPSDGNKG